MFLKRCVRKKCGKNHVYWQLVESYRTARGSRHRTVGYLGELCASEQTGWARLAANLDAKAIEEHWYERTVLSDILGVPPEQVNDSRLYRTLDRVLPLKEKIEEHLRRRAGEMFSLDLDLLLYDITSTYFEGLAEQNLDAQRGYIRDHRPDCKQVCIGVGTPKSLLRKFERELLEADWHTVREGVEVKLVSSPDGAETFVVCRLEHWAKRAGLGNGVRIILDELRRIKACDVLLPTSAGRRIRLSCVTRPDDHQRAILDRLGLALPERLSRPSWVKNPAQFETPCSLDFCHGTPGNGPSGPFQPSN